MTDRFIELYSKPMVVVIVGLHQQRLYAHKHVLCAISRFFAAALEGGFRESMADKIRLPDERPWAVAIFLDWLNRVAFKDVDTDYPELATLCAHLDLCELYLLGDRLQVPDFRNVVLGAIWQVIDG
ncbi:MAG: hypothetical protein M1833_005402 [Piccolia ochrophora]|nr:MAG: hypothetical protein M1833_005402 [Piccolia ochrophora]